MTALIVWKRVQRWWALALILFVLDWVTKQAVVSNLFYGQEIAVFPFFDLTLRYNTGAAFSFLAQAGGWQRWFFSLIALAVVVGISWRLVKIAETNRLESLALTFVLGGAIGNLYDRLVYGHVVDFLQFHWQQSWYFPAFNLADSAITIGVILMLLESFVSKKQEGTKE
ncbi:MAG: lipoprotein signal peptidase [Gammaproteobacteria bacterium]|jgi:signal peptidase II|uniref:signal peptidase II n=1 Tax=Marinomonas TaxID=28253 RepID=UPI000C1DEF79|nr:MULTISPECIES: signal peptidase II [unclassified Marinomonas]MBU1296321.1 lipoprotein signal peptidase [Gammaproteobacteria bacterium]MBU1468355.1 lipoprotein signal peptidase [Gammaproteobacteria bacterium]MBU2239900.1 lipoprotein signal peptidase [Gammaproteobacteria bacterium]MBU2318887.1 lipoprotein signal peptidase [Gammaproteobacteria bacterium]MBU2413817.1 lipoprotein signal peptidase [Gammaproteobacteria bacterium]|tara:strand:- start:1448 stop:1954 length:507 start_codon:yes stop_codon:yes gene_type:complete